MKKRTNLFLLLMVMAISAISLNSIAQESLYFRYANASFTPGSPHVYQYDVQIKASTSGTQLYSWTVRSNFNNSTFVGTNTSMTISQNAELGLGWFGPNANPTIGGTAPSKYWTSSAVISAGGYIVPTDWVTLITVTMEVNEPCGLAGLNFITTYMQTRNKYRTNINYTVVADNNWTNEPVYTPATSTTWDGSESNEWYNADNWSSGFPCAGANVIIASSGNECEVNQNAFANSLSIENGGKLTLPSGKTLTVTNAFVVESGGSFIQNGTLTAGSIVVERYIDLASSSGKDGWHFLSSPVVAQSISPNFGGGSGHNFYAWDETVTNGLPWINYNGGSMLEDEFVVGKGYLIAYESGKGTGITKEFIGNLNNVSVEGIQLTKSNTAPPEEDWNGFNLLGNPFPSAVVWNKTDWNGVGPIQAAAYLWDEAIADYKDLFEDEVVPAMNGFMVYTAANATIDIPLAARVHDATPWYKASEEQRITLVAHDPATGSSKGSMVRFNSQATSGYDLDFDSRLLVGYAPIFFSKAEGTNLQVNTLPELTSDVVVPFGFITNGSTNFYIQMTATIETENILLVDRKLNIVHDLTANPVYHFTSAEGDDVNRFELKFGHVGVNANPASRSDVNVYVRDRSIYVSGNSSLSGQNIIVTNMMGQQVMKVSANEGLTVVNASNLQSGAYLVSVISESRIVTQKIVLNR
jgi:hypothetical protein